MPFTEDGVPVDILLNRFWFHTDITQPETKFPNSSYSSSLFNVINEEKRREMLKNIFVYYQNGDEDTQHYKEIGGRKSWISYLESNPISFIIGGVVITPDLVIKSGYTIITAIASIIMADLFG